MSFSGAAVSGLKWTSLDVIASSTFPPQVSVVLLGTRGFSGLQPATVTAPPVLPPPSALGVSPPSSPLPPHAASSVTAEMPATKATVRVVPRMDVLLLWGSAVRVNGRSGLPPGGAQPCNAQGRRVVAPMKGQAEGKGDGLDQPETKT